MEKTASIGKQEKSYVSLGYCPHVAKMTHDKIVELEWEIMYPIHRIYQTSHR